MTCQQCLEELVGQDPLPQLGQGGEKYQLAQQHLSQCSDCQAQWRTFSETLEQLAHWQVEEPSRELMRASWNRLQSEIKDAPPAQLSWWQRFDLALQRFARHRPTPWTGLVTVIFAVALLGHVLAPNWSRGRSSADRSACERNRKVVVQALAAYARENQQNYPSRLEQLIPHYLKQIPHCPQVGSDSYRSGYQVSSDRRSYQLVCHPEN